jgi:hypothetical protein
MTDSTKAWTIWTRRVRWGLWLAVPVAFGLHALSLGQDANFDLRNYHVYVASALLTGRGSLDIAPGYHASYHNPALYVPLYLGLRWLDPRLFSFLLAGVQSLAFVLLYLFVEGILGRPRSIWGAFGYAAVAVTGVLGAGHRSELGTTFSDNLLASPVLLALFLLMRRFRQDGAVRPSEFLASAASGAVLGIAVGLKTTFGVYAFGLIAAATLVGRGMRQKALRVLGVGTGIGAGAALTAGPWAAVLYKRFGNPIFPYMNDLFKSPMANPWGYRDLSFVPQSVADWFASPFFPALSPFRVGEVGFVEWRFVAVLGAGAVLLVHAAIQLVRRNRAETEGWPAAPIVVFFLVSYVAWYGLFGIYRYAIALEMLSPVVVFLAIVRVVSGIRWRVALACAALIPLVVTTYPGNWGRCAWGDDFLGIEFPPGVDWNHAMVVVAGRIPEAYLAAALPPDVPMVRIEASGDPVRTPTFPGPPPRPTQLGRAAYERIAKHAGPMYLVARNPTREWMHLAAYDLRVNTCEGFRPQVESRRWVQFCELRRPGQPKASHLFEPPAFGSP